jgi:hypothetical protein
VTTLKVRTGGEGSTQVTVPSSDYYLEPANRISGEPARWIELGSGLSSGVTRFTAGKRTVEIAGDWVRSAIPSDINDVCIEMVIQQFRTRGLQLQTGASPFDGGDLEAAPRALSPRAIAILVSHGWKQSVYLP